MQFAIGKNKVRTVDKTFDHPGGTDVSRGVLSIIGDSILHLTTYRFWKGIMDRVISLLGIIVLSPLFLFISIAIRLDSPGSAIYRRHQIGKNGQRFTAYKFRTMFQDCDDIVYKSYLVKYVKENAPYTLDDNGKPVFKVVDDPRVSRFGAILRNTNLDELPQLFNILKGEMSLVGPRPDVPFAVNMYENWQRKRLAVTPGITGLWQVMGRKGLSFKHMVNLDLLYIRKQSLLLDAFIAFRTLVTILTRDGS